MGVLGREVGRYVLKWAGFEQWSSHFETGDVVLCDTNVAVYRQNIYRLYTDKYPKNIPYRIGHKNGLKGI